MSDNLIVLSHYQAQPIIAAREAGQDAVYESPDLNLTTAKITLDEDGIVFPGGERLAWTLVEEIAETENKCYELVEDNAIREVRVFSEATNWVRTLFPTESAPTTLVSGMLMHRILGTDPYEDTQAKIKAARPVGRVLDTATGLGYTAIEAAKRADHVLTIDLDPAVIEVAKLNPWSQELFDNPKIEMRIGHAWDVVEELEGEIFSTVIHDPPTISLGGDMYDGDFYAELYRVMRPTGRLFHYIGDPESPQIHSLEQGIIDRLHDVGFKRVKRNPRAFGVVADKSDRRR